MKLASNLPYMAIGPYMELYVHITKDADMYSFPGSTKQSAYQFLFLLLLVIHIQDILA